MSTNIRKAKTAPPLLNSESTLSNSESTLSEGLLSNNNKTEERSSMRYIAFIAIAIILGILILVLVLVIPNDSISVTDSIKYGDSKYISTLKNRLVLSEALKLTDLSSDGSLAYTTKDSNVLVYGLKKYDILAKFSYNQISASDTIVNIRFVLDDKYLVACTWEGVLRMWNLEKKTEVLQYKFPSYLSSFKITKDHKSVVAYGGYSIYDLNLETQKMSQRVGPPPTSGTIIDMNLSMDNKLYAAITEKLCLHVWIFDTKYEVAKFELSERYSSIYFTNDSKYLIAHGEKSITIWQTSNWSKVAYIQYEAKIYSTQSTNDSRYIVLATSDGADILEIETGAQVAYLDYDVKGVAISQGNRYLFAFGGDQKIEIFNLESESKITEIETYYSLVYLKLSDDQKHLISVNEQAQIEVWEIIA